MKKITVVGAGHGGLIAAAKLAEKGHDVTVYERRKKEELGHDWEDRFTFSLLTELTGKEIPADAWRYRGDCAFVSPDFQSKVVIRYDENNRQKMMWRKPLINMLVDYAAECGVKFEFERMITGVLTKGNVVTGVKTTSGIVESDLVIDAGGVFSVIRQGLPDEMGIEKKPKKGDVFYAYRAYFNKIEGKEETDVPFEVYLCHREEQGLSWHLINDDCVDILVGRVDELSEEKVAEELDNFRDQHPCTGKKVLHGGVFGTIPVRRPLTLMVANGYAAVGDSAFMTTPMNGMGIDLSLRAGDLLAKTINENEDCSAKNLWIYNREFHRLYGGETAKNEGLKNSLLAMPVGGVDFLFKNRVIQSSDLSGAGKNTKLSALLGKFVRGMKEPEYFFAIIKGLIKGGKAAKLYKKAPEEYDPEQIRIWNEKIKSNDISIER